MKILGKEIKIDTKRWIKIAVGVGIIFGASLFGWGIRGCTNSANTGNDNESEIDRIERLISEIAENQSNAIQLVVDQQTRFKEYIEKTGRLAEALKRAENISSEAKGIIDGIRKVQQDALDGITESGYLVDRSTRIINSLEEDFGTEGSTN